MRSKPADPPPQSQQPLQPRTISLTQHDAPARRVRVTLAGLPASSDKPAAIQLQMHKTGGYPFSCELRLPGAKLLRDQIDAAIRVAEKGSDA